MKQIIIMIFIISIVGINMSMANNANKTSTVIIHISDKDLAKSTILVRITDNYISGYFGSKEYKVLSDGNGYYKWRSNSILKPVLISIETGNLTILNSYLESNDNIYIEYSGKEKTGIAESSELKISGKGSKKFNVIKYIKNVVPDNIKTVDDQSFSEAVIKKGLDDADSSFIFRKRVLDNHKTGISKDIYEIIKADLYGQTHYIFYTWVIHQCKKSLVNKLIFKQNIEIFKKRFYDDNSIQALNSSNYITHLIAKASTIALIKSVNSKIDFYDIYKEIIQNYKSQLREKILISFLVRGGYGSREDHRYEIYEDAIKYISNPDYLKIAAQQASVIKKGVNAYPFLLPDTSGKLISLNDYKGKTVIVDFWFTGCGSCANLNKEMGLKVLPKYKNNSEVVFVSICVDKSEKMWKESVRTGEYTRPDGVNLFTETLGSNHDLIKYYEIQMFPTLMLIDKYGRIYSSQLPNSSTEMIPIIDSAILASVL